MDPSTNKSIFSVTGIFFLSVSLISAAALATGKKKIIKKNKTNIIIIN